MNKELMKNLKYKKKEARADDPGEIETLSEHAGMGPTPT